jgi:predicted nucleotidyltransferase
MIHLIEDKKQQLNDLCFQHRVRKLEIFGSGADGTFDPARSDLDFLVEFLPLQEGQLAPDYFGLLHGLEDLFQRKIDLVMERAIRNPYFLRGVNQSRQVIYAA